MESRQVRTKQEREDLRRRKESQKELNRLVRLHRKSLPKGKSPAFWNKQLDKILEDRYGTIYLVKNKGLHKKSKSLFQLYRIENTIYKRVETFVRACFPKILSVLSINHKVVYSLKFTLAKEDRDESNAPYIKKREHVENHHPIELIEQADLQASLENLPAYFSQAVRDLEVTESGRQLLSIDYLDTKLIEYTPLVGGCDGKLPKNLCDKQCVINMQNTDNQCLKWAVTLLYFNIQGKNRGRITKTLKQAAEHLNWKNVSFPAGVKDLETFSKHNPSVALYVYGKQDDQYFILFNGFRQNNSESVKKIFLFYYNGHYFPIVNILAFHRWIFNSKDKTYVCFDGLTAYTSQRLLDEHRTYCRKDAYTVRTKMPPRCIRGVKNTIHFKNHRNTQFYPYVVYLDTESAIESGDNTQQKHVPYIFGTLFIDHITHTQEYNTWKTAQEFIQYLVRLARSLPHRPEVPPEVSTKATHCYYCQKSFTPQDPPVRDHCHFSGKFRGMAHQSCNLLLVQKRILPVFAHNMCKYDEKTFIRALEGEEDFTVDIIAKNIENFVSFGFTVTDSSTQRSTSVKFLGSLKFLSGSLETLTQNLLHKGKDAFVYTKKIFEQGFHDILLQKGVFPYEYVTNEAVLDKTTTLPPHYQFYSSLKHENVSNEDYARAQQVWNLFQCQNLRDYMNIYLKLDIGLLADIFENFRTCIYSEYTLDPVYYLTLSSLAIDCALKYTRQTLEKIHCPTMHNFIERGICGGISMITQRYAKANNEACSYDPTQEKSYILYLDANNLYGWAMMENLPVGHFRWLDNKSSNIPDNAFVDVDLHCPEHLFEKFREYPLCPTHENKKLLNTLYKKEHYICHARYLKFVLEQGYVLDKVHKILAFDEKPWLKSYIEKKTALRAKAESTFEKDLWKLMNNAVFGKQIENVRKRITIRLESEKSVKKLIQKPNFKNVVELETTTEDRQYLLEMNKLSVTLDKPIYGGATILDLSNKILMGEFYYNYLKKKFGNRYRLLFTDTDSFMGIVQSSDVYQELAPDVNTYFDTSNYPHDHFFPKVNKKVPGLFKDEMGGQCITEFCGLRAKQYAYRKASADVFRCKGVNVQAMKSICFEDYYQCLFENKPKHVIMQTIRSKKHVNYTLSQPKKALDAQDDKREILANNIDTAPWGWKHHKDEK